MRIIAVATLLALGVMAGCGRGTGPGSEPEKLPEGRTFLSTAVTGHDLKSGTQITLSFQKGKVGAHAGCNNLFGTARLDGGRLLVSDVGGTEMACEKALMAQDEWLTAFLSSEPEWLLDGNELTLTQGSTQVRLVDRKHAEPDKPLKGTRWVLDTLTEGEAASAMPSGVTAWLKLGKDGVATGNAGCNQFGGGPDGNFTVEGTTIRFHDLAVTRMSCGEERDALERKVLAVLDGPVAYQVEGNQLTVTHPSKLGLRFHAG